MKICSWCERGLGSIPINTNQEERFSSHHWKRPRSVVRSRKTKIRTVHENAARNSRELWIDTYLGIMLILRKINVPTRNGAETTGSGNE
jgi:hypothetical protein